MMSTPTFTDREIEVIRLIAAGFSLDEIAGQLGLARSTVKTYAERARLRAGVRKTRQLPQAYLEATGDNPFAP